MNFIFCEFLIKTLLISFVGSNPVIKYSFCQWDHNNCKPKEFGANSTLIFGNLNHNVYIDTETAWPQLSISCIASEPMRWAFSADLGLHIQPVVSNLTVHGKSKTFYYEVQVSEVNAGVVRCESYENPSQAAEIYVDATNDNSKYPYAESKINSFYYEQVDINGLKRFLVPCILRHPHFKNQDKLTLKKITRDQMKPESFTEDCIQCITKRDVANKKCGKGNCGPLWMSRKMWVDAGCPQKNDTARDMEPCLSDLNCSLKTFNLSKNKIPLLDCNDDGWTTCSDRFSAIRSYPNGCQNSQYLKKNFNEIESCVFEAQEKPENDARYDPRFGFILSPIDPEAIYMCPRVNVTNPPVILSMSSPGPEIKATMAFNRADSTSTTVKGLSCQVLDSSTEEPLQFHVISCKTAFDCQTQLETTGTRRQFRRTENMKIGEPIKKNHLGSHKFGKVISDPVKQGAALCFGFLTNGFVRKFDLFFTGLDDQLYFLNGVKPPKAAIIVLTSDATNMTIGEGITFNCTIAHFILFPVFRFTFKFSNGTTRETSEDLHTTSTDYQLSVSKTMTMTLPANLKSLECAAPYRDSSQWATDILDVQNNSFMETTPGTEDYKTDGIEESITNGKNEDKNYSLELGGVNNSTARGINDSETDGDSERSPEISSFPHNFLQHSPVTLAFILTPAAVVLLVVVIVLAVVFCRRYKVAQDLRDLTSEEVDNFLHGKTSENVIIFNSDKNFNAESVDFPVHFCIVPSDVETNARDVLWEGEHSQFITGKYQGKKVAIKVAKSNVDVDSFKDILLQIKTTVHVQGHVNILNCIGAVVDDLKQRKCLAIFELSPYGDLISYLQYNALRESEFENYNVNVANTYTKVIWKSNARQITLKKIHLYYFCEQIAAGMEFLGSKKVVHGKLGARNVLVFPSHVVKITDFGLSRNLYKASNYKKGSNTLLPWRWMAIESLKYMEFSPVTDMWSFGVTTWEIFSMGKIPYSDIQFSSRFADQLDGGLRLTKPEHATDQIYQFMCRTWNCVPSARPSFTESRQFFKGLLMGSRPSIC